MKMGLQIAKLRSELGWSVTQFSQRLGTNTSSVKSWENGSSIPSTENIIKICHLLHTTPNTLLDFDRKPVVLIDDLSESDQRKIRGIVQLFFDEENRRGKTKI